MSFDPRRIVELGAGDDGMQRGWPVVTSNGRLELQPGDGHPVAYPVVGLGMCHGSIGNARWNTDLSAALVVTDCRAVVIATRWAQGAKYSASGFHGPIITATVKTKVAQAKANRKAAGQALVAQMRYPWIGRVAYSVRAGRKGDNVIRLCGSHTTAFGEEEHLMLLVQFDKNTDPRPIAQSIAGKVVADRYDWESTTSAARAQLAAAVFTDPATLPVGSLPSIALAGSWRAPGSSWVGTFSSRSLPAPADATDRASDTVGHVDDVDGAAPAGRIVDQARSAHVEF